MLSHLSVCFRTWCVFFLGSVRLGICEHGNSRLNEVVSADCKRTLERFAISVKAIRPNGPANQAVSQCMMGNFVKLREAAGIVLLMAPKMNRELTWSREEVKCLIKICSDEHLSKTPNYIKCLANS